MDQRTNKSVKAFVAAASKMLPGFAGAYLFGSFAKNTEKLGSDIDIAFVIKELADEEKFDLQVELMLLASQFDSRIEPHPISFEDVSSCSSFANEIRTNGIEIAISGKAVKS